MKKNGPARKTPGLPVKAGIWGIVRMFFSAFRILHSGLGAPRIILAYLFLAFAFVGLIFTVSIPTGADFTLATAAAKVQSRILTAFMMIVNLGVYGMIMNWHRTGKGLAVIRIALIGLLLYMDVTILGRVIYTLIREGSLF